MILTCTDRGSALHVNLMEELVSWDSTISRKRIHHPAIRCDGESAAEEHGTNDDDLGLQLSGKRGARR